MEDSTSGMKTTLEVINRKLDELQDWINDLEDKIGKNTQPEQQTEKIYFLNEGHLRDLWDNVKHINIPIIEKYQKEKKENQESTTYLKK